MKFKALITALVLSTSSVALAKPVLQVDFDTDLSLRDRRGSWRPMWAPLSNMVTAGRRNVIQVDDRDGHGHGNHGSDAAYTAIRLKNGTGATYVYSIKLRYGDGHTEDLTVGKWLYSGAPIMTFDLAHEGLDRITVQTWTNSRSTYQVLGQKMRNIVRPPVIQPQPLPPPLPMPTVGLVIGKDLSFANSAGYVHIPVGVDKGRFQKVRIASTGSSTHLGNVYVTFATGKQQLFSLNKAMYRGETIDLDLEGYSAQTILAVTLMSTNDVRAVGPSASRFSVSLL